MTEERIDDMAVATLSAKEVAVEFGTDARTLRKFLRSHLPKDDQPGQGGRYTFTKGEVAKLKKAFAAWSTPKATATDEAPAKGKKGKKAKDEVDAGVEAQDEIDRTTEEVDLDDDGEPVELDDLDGPSEEDLEDLEDE